MSTLVTTTAQIGTIKDAGGNATSMTIDSSGVITHAAGFNNYVEANFTAGSTTLNPTLTAIPSWANIITCSFFDLSGGQADIGHRVTGNHYNHQYTNYRVVFDGRISLSGPISGISLLHSANFDAGSVRVIWS